MKMNGTLSMSSSLHDNNSDEYDLHTPLKIFLLSVYLRGTVHIIKHYCKYARISLRLFFICSPCTECYKVGLKQIQKSYKNYFIISNSCYF